MDKDHEFEPFKSKIIIPGIGYFLLLLGSPHRNKSITLIQDGKIYFMLGHTKCFAPSVRSHSLFTTVLWLLLSEVYLPSWYFFLVWNERFGVHLLHVFSCLHLLFSVQSKMVCETFFIRNSNKIKPCHHIPSKDVGKDSNLSSWGSHFKSCNS